MSCDQHFERCLQNTYDAVFQTKNKKPLHESLSAAPHRLVGTEVWLEAGGNEVVFLEGVTGLHFCDGKVVFQTVLGETITLAGELERVTLREGGLILQSK